MLDVHQRVRALPAEHRASGLPGVGAVPWGTHLAVLHRGTSDVLPVLCAFLAAGLDAHEQCVWITPDPVEALRAIRRARSSVDDRLRSGQLVILPEIRIARDTTPPESPRLWSERTEAAVRGGWQGLRVVAGAPRLDGLHAGGGRMLGLSSMDLTQVEPEALVAFGRAYDLALMKRGADWELHRGQRSRIEDELAPPEPPVDHLQRVTAALAKVSSLADIAAVVVREMADAARADLALLAVPSDDGRQIVVLERIGDLEAEGSTDLPTPTGASPRIKLDSDLPLPDAFRIGKAVWLDSAEEIAAAYPHLETTLGAIVALPLSLGGRRLGAVELGFRSPRAFTPAFRRALEDLGRQVVFALDRARLLEDAERHRDRLQLLSDATAHLSRAGFDVTQVLTALAAEIVHGFAARCGVYLTDGGGGELREIARRHAADLAGDPAPWPSDLLARVAETNRPVRRTGHGDAALAPAEGPLLIVPIRCSGRILGVVAASRRPEEPVFGRDDQELLQELANRAALFVENAGLYEAAQADRQRAEQANRAKDDFLAMLGHELRNPLSPILTVLQLLARREGAPFAAERAVMERQVRHMIRLVDDLLDVSRIARGIIEIRRADVALDAVVDQAVEATAAHITGRRHQLEVDVPRGLVLYADADRLTQVVANLLSNAAKYTPPGGRITIRARRDGGRIVLAVRDSGIGIEPDLLPRIFDTFAQGRQGIDRSQGGLGLGLAIVRSMVEMHGGTVEVHSDGPGTGSEFTLTLPSSPSGAASAQDGPALRVFVADESDATAQLVARALRAGGHDVTFDADAGSLDVALLDVRLPTIEARAAQLRRAHPAITLIALTSAPDTRRSDAGDFDAHLAKPLDLAALPSLLRALHLR